MRLVLPLLLIFAAPALAQNASPIMVVGGEKPTATAPAAAPASQAEQERLIQNFPDWAITSAGENTTGQNAGNVAGPKAPENPPAPAASANPAAPHNPEVPKAPVSPKLWPVDTVPIFLRACVGIEPQMIAPCGCVIRELMVKMPHDEFLQKSANGTIEQDPTLNAIRVGCATEPHQKAK